MARWMKADGTSQEVHPANGGEFTYEEIRGYVGGNIEFVSLLPMSVNGGLGMFVEEEGIYHRPVNNAATSVLWEYYPAHEQQGTHIHGDVLIATAAETGDA